MNSIRKLLAAILALFATAATAGLILVCFPAAPLRSIGTVHAALRAPPAMTAAGSVARN